VNAMRAVIGILIFCLGGCSSLSAPPRDNFYRLNISAPQGRTAEQDSAALTFIAPFSASGLHGERALIYAHADGIALEQYNYHFWIDSPRTLLQTSLAEYLQDVLGVQVVLDATGEEEMTIRGRIVRFEREAAGGSGRGVVALQFDVFRGDGRVPLLTRRYESAVNVEEDSIAAVATAVNAATADVYARFSMELRSLY
jgi:ABC-type uncharacterized transport system auxiliary subunit